MRGRAASGAMPHVIRSAAMRGGRSASAGETRRRRPCPGPRFAPGGTSMRRFAARTPRCEPPVGVDRYALAGQGPASSERIYNQRPCLQTAQASTFGCGVRERAALALRRTAPSSDTVFSRDATHRRRTGLGVPCWRTQDTCAPSAMPRDMRTKETKSAAPWERAWNARGRWQLRSRAARRGRVPVYPGPNRSAAAQGRAATQP